MKIVGFLMDHSLSCDFCKRFVLTSTKAFKLRGEEQRTLVGEKEAIIGQGEGKLREELLMRQVEADSQK